jgi:hypothetical protein
VRDERRQLAARAHAELAVDVATVRAHRLDAHVQRDRDLGVGAPVAQMLEHIGLARRQQVGPRRMRRPGGGHARQHVHPARGEVDRVEDVARLRVLRQAGSRSERQHLAAVDLRRPVGEHDESRLGMRGVDAVHFGGPAERAEVHDRDLRAGLGEGRFERVGLEARGDDLDVRVVVEECPQPAVHEILEPGQGNGDGRVGPHASLSAARTGRRPWLDERVRRHSPWS